MIRIFHAMALWYGLLLTRPSPGFVSNVSNLKFIMLRDSAWEATVIPIPPFSSSLPSSRFWPTKILDVIFLKIYFICLWLKWLGMFLPLNGPIVLSDVWWLPEKRNMKSCLLNNNKIFRWIVLSVIRVRVWRDEKDFWVLSSRSRLHFRIYRLVLYSKH